MGKADDRRGGAFDAAAAGPGGEAIANAGVAQW